MILLKSETKKYLLYQYFITLVIFNHLFKHTAIVKRKKFYLRIVPSKHRPFGRRSTRSVSLLSACVFVHSRIGQMSVSCQQPIQIMSVFLYELLLSGCFRTKIGIWLISAYDNAPISVSVRIDLPISVRMWSIYSYPIFFSFKFQFIWED